MKYSTIAGYVVGHVINDLTASIWFTYTIIFFTRGVKLPAYMTGILILIGQISDGIATPLVGVKIDRSLHLPRRTFQNHFFQRLMNIWPSSRKGWHLGGVLLVTVAFPFLFYPLPAVHTVYRFIFYALWAMLFQFGWATVQISHLSLINDLTVDPGERTLLTSIRYLFNILSNMTVFIGFYVIFHNSSPKDKHSSAGLLRGLIGLSREASDNFDSSDARTFWYLCLFVIGLGFTFSVIFHLLVRDSDMIHNRSSHRQETYQDQAILEQEEEEEVRLSPNEISTIGHWKEWLVVTDFWLMGGCYMMTRLIVNISQSYISSYLVDFLHLSKTSIALVPLTIYLSSMLVTVIQKPLSSKLSREVNCLFGLLFTVVFCILVKYPGEPPSRAIIFSAAALLGIGSTTLLVTNLTMVSDLIGSHTHTSAFVFGAMSFTDKLANGITIQIVQLLDLMDGKLYQQVEVYGVGAFCLGFFVFLAVRLVLRLVRKRIVIQVDAESLLTSD